MTNAFQGCAAGCLLYDEVGRYTGGMLNNEEMMQETLASARKKVAPGKARRRKGAGSRSMLELASLQR